jgi:hypothetical protein
VAKLEAALRKTRGYVANLWRVADPDLKRRALSAIDAALAEESKE